jgi:hypothetical protein
MNSYFMQHIGVSKTAEPSDWVGGGGSEYHRLIQINNFAFFRKCELSLKR